MPAPWISTSHRRRRFRTFVCLRPHLSDCHLGSSRLQPRTPAAHSLVFDRLNARFGSALTTPPRACTVTTGSAGCLARMACVPPWSLTFTLLTSRLRSSSRSRRTAPTGRPSAPTSTAGAQLTSSRSSAEILGIQEGAGFVTRSSLEQNFHIANQHYCAVLLNKDTLTRNSQVSCTHTYASWEVEGMVVTSKFRRAPAPACSYFTIANIHINNVCAKRGSVCIAMLLLIRDLCTELSAVVLTGDINKAVERELPSWRPQWTPPSGVN